LSRAAALILSGAILGSAAFAADGAAAPKQTSSCIACHTDAEKLKAEAAKIPPAAGSALQAGKG
jgi:cytochrome c553